jgi:hypothetical protein
MNSRPAAFAFSIVLLTGCGGGYGPSRAGTPGLPGSSPESAAKVKQLVYWTLYAGRSFPEVEHARVPLTAKSKPRDIGGNTKNDLNYTSGMTVDAKGKLWILSFGRYSGNPGTAVAFKLPMKAAAMPLYTFVLSGTSGANALTFDSSGNLWVASPGNSSVLEYTGSFTKSGTLSPAITISAPGYKPAGIAVDKSANVYVSNFESTGKNSIGVLAPPYNGAPFFLNGLKAPGGLVFDKQGNLYASTDGSAPAVVRYDSNDLKKGAKPSVVDSTGLPAASYEAAFAFTSTGDLYAANCGNSDSAGIDVWPLSKKEFSKTLSPSVRYTNADIQDAGCAWGLAVR